MTLSKQNYDFLNENFLYKKEPIRDENESHIGNIPMSYWCQNWTFRVKKYNGKALMVDTYWGESSNDYIEVTDENISEFEFVFDFREVMRISNESAKLYNDGDVIRVPTDSGGINSDRLCWVSIDTKKSLEKCIDKKKQEIESLKWKLGKAERELKELMEVI